MMHRIIAGGTGFIGRYLVQQWLAQDIPVTVISRSKDTVQKVFGDKVMPLTWQELSSQPASLIRAADIIVNLCGANIGTHRWSATRKQEIIDSRLEPTRLLTELCTVLGDKAPPLLNASAIGIYGLPTDFNQQFDENSVINFEAFPDFVSAVTRPWETTTIIAKAHGVHVVNLRFGVVLGPNGGVLKQLSLPFKLGLGGKIGSGQQPFSWIHIHDLANIIEFLLKNLEVCGPVNIVAPEWVTQEKFAKTLAKVLHRPCVMTTPAALLHLIYGQMADELLLSGQIVKPTKLINAGYQFAFPTLEAALKDIYS
jgi:hypothetical protein